MQRFLYIEIYIYFFYVKIILYIFLGVKRINRAIRIVFDVFFIFVLFFLDVKMIFFEYEIIFYFCEC